MTSARPATVSVVLAGKPSCAGGLMSEDLIGPHVGFSESCEECLSLGYACTAETAGFDDLADVVPALGDPGDECGCGCAA